MSENVVFPKGRHEIEGGDDDDNDDADDDDEPLDVGRPYVQATPSHLYCLCCYFRSTCHGLTVGKPNDHSTILDTLYIHFYLFW